MISLFLSQPPPHDDFWYGPVGQQTAAGIDVDEDSALTLSAVWACTRLLSSSVGVLPFNLFEKVGGHREIAEDHPVHTLIHYEPNPDMGSMSWRINGTGQQVNRGNAYSEIVRDAFGRITSLQPIFADRVEAYRADARQSAEFDILAGSLIWKVRNDGEPATWIPDRDMFHPMSHISDNGIVGKGVITHARETIAHGLATEIQGAAYMANSARPSVAITGGKFKTPEDRAYYRATWMETHGGASQNALPAMLPEGAEIKPLSFSPNDSQFLETRQHTVEEIARWYGVPPHMIGHLLRSTFSNIENQGIEWVVYGLIPWLKPWEEEVSRKLLTPAERKTHYAKFNVEGLLRGDSAARSAFYQALWQMGVFSINEIREKEDMNPIGEEGDERFVQSSYVTLSSLDEEPEPPPPQFPPPPPQQQPEPPPEDNGQMSNGHARQAAVAEAARLMIEETTERMRNRETLSLERHCRKEPKEFFAWLDEFYVEHGKVMSEALRRPVKAYLLATDGDHDADQATSRLSGEWVARSKSDVLEATGTVQSDQWDQFAARLTELTSTWAQRSITP